MVTHDYLMRIAAEERYTELLKSAEQERRLRIVDDVPPAGVSVWKWVRQWFQHHLPAFRLTKMRIGF